jgi:hypothetical protein
MSCLGRFRYGRRFQDRCGLALDRRPRRTKVVSMQPGRAKALPRPMTLDAGWMHRSAGAPENWLALALSGVRARVGSARRIGIRKRVQDGVCAITSQEMICKPITQYRLANLASRRQRHVLDEENIVR